jgi:hypothetical protein
VIKIDKYKENKMKKDKFVGSYEGAMMFLVNIARKYRVESYNLDESNSEDGKWVSKISYNENILYDPNHYWFSNDTILDAEKMIPYYVALDDNFAKKEKGLPYVELRTTGSTIDFWKDELNKIK